MINGAFPAYSQDNILHVEFCKFVGILCCIFPAFLCVFQLKGVYLSFLGPDVDNIVVASINF